MKYQRPLTKKPLYKLGGSFLDDKSDPTSIGSIGASLGSGLSSAISPEKSAPDDFMSMGFGKSLTRESNIEKGRVGLEKAAANFGPVGQLAAVSSAIGRGVDNATKDDFGVYRSKGAQALDTVLDPIGTVTDLFSGELFGGQKDRRKEKDQYFNNLNAAQVGQNELLGAQLKNSIPTYSAPAYAKHGMKFRSKFNRGGTMKLLKEYC